MEKSKKRKRKENQQSARKNKLKNTKKKLFKKTKIGWTKLVINNKKRENGLQNLFIYYE